MDQSAHTEESARVIEQTRNWIQSVVIQCNFCPFASREMKQQSVHFRVEFARGKDTALQAFRDECSRLDRDPAIATTLLIFPNAFPSFTAYLEILHLAEERLRYSRYTGIYQIASFHPLYRFAGASAGDPANYTNRSPYPMLHLLREEAIEKALQHYPDPEGIPQRNMRFAREKGEAYMKMLRDGCL